MSSSFFIAVALGDSLTVGYRQRDPYAIDLRVPYPAQLEMLIRDWLIDKGSSIQAFVLNAGINGDSTNGMLWRFSQDVSRESPDAVVVWGGINDLVAGRDPKYIADNLTELYRLCREARAIPIACTLSPTRRTSMELFELNQLIRDRAKKESIMLADIFTPLKDSNGNLKHEYSDDGAHLTLDGYGRVAQEIFSVLEPLLRNYSQDQ